MGIFSAGQRASRSRADEAAGPAGAGGSGGGSEASASSGPSRTPSASGASERQVVLSEDALKAAEAAGRGAGDAEATAVRDETYLEDVSVYKLFAFQAVGMPERRVCGLAAPHNFLRFAVFCFYFLGVVAVQALTPAALFVNQYRSKDSAGSYKSACSSDGRLSAKLLVFLVTVMYVIRITPAIVTEFRRFLAFDELHVHDLSKEKVEGFLGLGKRAMRRQVSQRAPKRSDFFSGFGAGFGPNRGDLAFLDEKLQEALAWEQGGSSVFAFYIHVFAQTAYIMFAYTFNLFIIYNSASAFDVVFNALAIEFIIQFDEESVGPLLALQEGLFGIDTADFTEGVVAAVDRIERESAGYTSMNVFIAKLCRMGPAKAALVYCLRNYFTRFALLVLLVFFEIVLLAAMFWLPVCY